MGNTTSQTNEPTTTNSVGNFGPEPVPSPVPPPTPVPEPNQVVSDDEMDESDDESETSQNYSAPATPSFAPNRFVHPLIEMVNNKVSEQYMISMLETYCGKQEVGVDDVGQPIYEFVDQTEFIAPVLQVFSYCASNSLTQVVQWLLDNFVPLQVSYDGNFCYYECLRWNHPDIANLLVKHESFFPTLQILENLMTRGCYELFEHCTTSPHLRGDLDIYRFTLRHYVQAQQYDKISQLLSIIKQRESGQELAIPDQIYPNPRFAQSTMTDNQTEILA